MKILHVNKFFDFHGGAEVYLHGLIAAQEEAGHDVHVFSTRGMGNRPSKDGKYFVTRYDLDRREGWLKDAKKAANFIWNLEAQSSFRRMLHDVKPDVIHLHNIYHHLSSSILAPIRSAGIPCVQTLHDYKLANPNYSMFCHDHICEHAKGGRYWEMVKHRCMGPSLWSNLLAVKEFWMTKCRQSYERTIDLFICPSRFMKNTMIEWGEPAKQMRYVPNPTDLPDEPAPSGGGYLLYAGRLSAEKGLKSFIEAASEVPELPVKIAGRGPEEQALRSLASKLHASHIEFLGFLPSRELARVRHHAEAVVLPTISYENASGALLEAMADGLPCLATRIGGNPELVEDEINGFLVTPGDVEDWVHTLQRFSALPAAARREMGERGRQKIIKNHLWSTHLKRLTQCYEEAGAS
jgi:glycosyltransferase involved in cell wall biosynthesis